MGFVTNPIIRQAIMNKNLLFKDVEAITEMIDKYNQIVMSLSVAEVCVCVCAFAWHLSLANVQGI